MQGNKHMKTISNIIYAVFLAVLLAFFALLPQVQAVNPPPDGGYPNGNTAEGDSALFRLTSGTENTAIGAGALYSDTAGSRNTATGFQTLNVNNGSYNTANGYRALLPNNGDFNTADGANALANNTSGTLNTATGFAALGMNGTGIQNTATGAYALQDNIASNNTATGFAALGINSTGFQNTATGAYALQISNGANNTADGSQALLNNGTGSANTATGESALQNNTTANYNTADGFQALLNNKGNNNIAVGSNAGSNLTTGNNNIDIGAAGATGESNTIRIGRGGVQTNAYMQGIRGRTVPSGITVIVGTDGHLGTVVSSARFKDKIEPMDKVSEAILALKPVTFRYKKALDPMGIPQFGLVAEQVADVNPDLVARDDQGVIYTVRYEAVNAMLLNEFLKEHKTVQEQGVTIAQQRKDFEAAIAQQQKQIEALTAGLQKVSAQLELSKGALQTVLNNQ